MDFCPTGSLVCATEAHSQSVSLQPVDEFKTFIDFNNVRIIPSKIEFKGAYEGKHFRTKITLQNIGKNIVFIRMTSPTSYAYTIKTFPRGIHLSPGLSIDREIELTYASVCVKTSILPIYINEQRFDMELEIIPSSSELMITPTYIDFGCVDAGLTSPPKLVQLQNVGSKGTKFSFDLAGGKHELIIEPSKGYLRAKQAITISVRLLTYKEGRINTELWIRSETPKVIAVLGHIIVAKFEAIHPNATSKFTVIDFPTTYHKCSYTKTLLVRNYSSTNSMFCVLGELQDGRMMPLSRCKNVDKSFLYFNVYPCEGRFEPKETKLFHLTFQPKETRENTSRLKGFYFVSIQIYKVNCRDIIPNANLFELETTPFAITQGGNVSTASFLTESVYPSTDTSLFRSESSAQNVNLAMRAERPFVRLYLHGLAENANVTIIPDAITLLEVKVNTKITRVLELQNNSDKLPIILHYKKVAYVELERNIFLKPNEKKQISVIINHHCIGLLNTQISFDLLHYNFPKSDNCVVIGNVTIPISLESVSFTKRPKPILNTKLTPNYIKEVGVFCDGFKYCDLMDNKQPKLTVLDAIKPDDKNCTDLIAFPNDRCNSLRKSNTNSKCTTLFTRKPRYVPPLDESYELTIFEREFKREIAAYYTNFTRREAQRLRSLEKPLKTIENEYSFAELYKVNFNNVPTLCGRVNSNKKVVKPDSFLPLSPVELNLISVSPLVIETGKIACYYGYNINLTITNRNSLSLRVYFKPDKPTVLFPDSTRRIIKPNSETQIEMVYMAGPPGYYVVTVDMIMNESVIAQVIILADVVPHSLQLSTYTIDLNDGKSMEYIDIINNLNVPINYFWDIPFCNFSVEPFSGTVRPRNNLTCALSYYSHIGGPNMVDIEFHSGDKDVQFVKINCELPDEKIELITKKVTFENIPLNIRVTRTILFRNPLKQSLSYSISEQQLEDLEILPEDGIIKGKQLIEITLSAQFQHCYDFNTSIIIDITRMGRFEVPVSGNVVYPLIKCSPTSLQFKNCPFSSTDFLTFSIKNQSAAIVNIQINMNDYQEYKVSEYKFHWESSCEAFTIEPGKIKTLYLHYMPIECAVSSFYLPMIVNGILGPVIISDPITLKVDYYLKPPNNSVQVINVPINLDVIKITGLAKAGKIIFSKLSIDFTLGIRTERRYKTQYDLKITNCQKESDDVCIRTDELESKPFELKSINKNIDILCNAMVCHLKPKDTVIINVEFCPNQYGSYKCILPVYLRSDLSLDFHNVIELNGNYMSPTITGERLTFMLHMTSKEKARDELKKMTFYSRPIPLKIIACSTKKYIFLDHYKNCRVNTKTNLPGLSIQIQWDTFYRFNDHDYEVEMTFKYSAEENTQFMSSVQIFCSCGGCWDATLIGCAENCFLTSYAFSETFLPDHLEALTTVSDPKKGYSLDLDSLFQSRPSLMSAISRRDIGHLGPTEFHTMEFFSSYPFFPFEVSSLSLFLERCLFCMEEWVCNQIFFKTIRHQIPETITSIYSIPKNEKITVRSKKDRRSDFLVPPYIKLLINMVGPQMVTYLALGPTPQTEEETCWYLYTIYENALRFIRSLGAYFICLKPEHLLDYNMFLVFKRCILPTLGDVATTTKSIKNSQEFYHLAKQSWLDLLLQTYKVLYLYRLNSLLMVPSGNSNIKPLEEFKKTVKNFSKNANIFSNAELLLINWLEYHYMNVKDEIWPEMGLEKRDVNFFGENLQDGFVFASVTGAYCPYLIKYLRKMFADADIFEDLFHNACIVTRCWRMLNCSFAVNPEDILDPNSVHMLMLIAYLFEVLPSMYPCETIEMKVGLSQKIYNKIVLKNINDFHICYKVIFFSNEDECFSTDKDIYDIPSGKSCKIIITYHAKFAKNVQCTLLLSGENDSYHYAKNRAFTLIGIPDITYMTSIIKYPIYLYQVSDVSFMIKSPYEITAGYNMQITYEMIENSNDLENVPFVRKEEFQKISKLIPIETYADFNDGLYEFKAFCCALIKQDETIWIYFRNSDVGDFAISFVVNVKESRLKEVIDVVLPKNFNEFGQSKTKRGMARVFIEIPCRNRLFWNAIMEIMLRVSEGDVLEFWKKNIGTTIGMQILQQIVLGTSISNTNISDSITYEITTDKDCAAILPESVLIEDEYSHNSIQIPVQFTTYSALPQDFTFSLQSSDGRFKRYYVTNFMFDS